MQCMSFDELKEKEVININDCTRLGYVTNVNIDISCGRVISFTVKDCSGFLSFKGEEYCVPWEKITKIGSDIIFADICTIEHQAPSKKKL